MFSCCLQTDLSTNTQTCLSAVCFLQLIYPIENPKQCRGFGYVTFALKEDAVQAQEKIRQINGRKLFITFSNKKPRHIKRGPPEKKSNDVEGGMADNELTLPVSVVKSKAHKDLSYLKIDINRI